MSYYPGVFIDLVIFLGSIRQVVIYEKLPVRPFSTAHKAKPNFYN